FFKAGPAYAAAEGKSLLDAFHLEGKWAMGLFYAVTVSSMFVVQAVVTLLTASVFSSIFEIQLPLWQVCAVILLSCSFILIVGKYRLLASLMKTVIVLLTVTTLITLIAAFFFDQPAGGSVRLFSFSETTDLFFLIALIGWMPAPLDISLWHSEWTLTANKEKNEKLDISKAVFDFNIGYWGTTLLAIAFVLLGALILRGNTATLPSGGAAFAGELIGMYVTTLGQWSFVFVAIAAFTTMFSTTLTVLDAYPRVLHKAWELSSQKKQKRGYLIVLGFMVVGALFVLIYQLENMKQLVDFATTVSFLTAPILASLISRVVRKSKAAIFTRLDQLLVWVGLVFLYCFSAYYIWIKFITQ
ncbi:MAG: divalent metal cation transporter, partial [Flavobacteriales bacterium]|nr:divalent metal cation transporter [Flavobacteriales bacterium]